MKKTPLSKTGKKHTNEWHRKECVKTAKLITKHLAGYKCVNEGCNKSADQGYQMHGSHILPEGSHHRMSVEVVNIMCQCAQHHMNWHENPLEQHEWFERTFPGVFASLNNMDKVFKTAYIKPDYKKMNEELKERYKTLIN